VSRKGPRKQRARDKPSPAGAGATPGIFADARWMALLLAVAVLIAYFPAINGQFLWDDDAHVTRPELQSLLGLWRIWFDVGATQQYYPLLHSAFWVEHALWGDSVIGYHLVNILLHATSAWLVWWILRRLAIPGAALAAGIFALHPVQVESVAWIAEQKNTLSTVFALGALAAYLRFYLQFGAAPSSPASRRRAAYLIASALFVLGLLTKTVIATLPVVILIILWWQRGRLSWRRDVLPLLPWLALGAAAGLLTAWVERSQLGAAGAPFALTFLQRTLLAGRAIVFYARTLVWPTELLFVYPRWQIATTADGYQSLFYQSLFVVGVLTAIVICWLLRHRTRAPLAATLVFIATLGPALGFVNVYPFVFSFVADHFQYVACLGLITLAAAGLARAATRLPPPQRWIAPAGAALLLGTLAILTWRQCQRYRDPETLYQTTLAGNDACYLCLNNLGLIAFQAGRVDEATTRFTAAVALQPDSAEAQSNLANVLVERGAIADGIDHYQLALKAAPRNVITRTNLGIALVRAGRLSEAASQFEEALRIMPDYAPARRNLSVLQSLPPQAAPR
jgi:tetratricopeptide (TPR) repeat protein